MCICVYVQVYIHIFIFISVLQIVSKSEVPEAMTGTVWITQGALDWGPMNQSVPFLHSLLWRLFRGLCAQPAIETNGEEQPASVYPP
jgi:hypothetical protein